MANKKLLSVLLSISIAASSLSFTGCGEHESGESVEPDNEKISYLLEFEDDDLIIYETKNYPLHNGFSYNFVTLDGRSHTADISRCIVLKTREEAEDYYNMYISQKDKNVVWIGDVKERTKGITK